VSVRQHVLGPAGSAPAMKVLNLGVLAHVDAGKTSLTERLLYAGGVIVRPGSVDTGDTQTDTMELERSRGITIRSAVASFWIDDVLVNLIDTPGHPDFVAEVERVLAVLDAAVLVVSAVEGVQPQTRVLMRILRRLCIPTLIFINKLDRAGAEPEEVALQMDAELAQRTLHWGWVTKAGGPDAAFHPFAPEDPDFVDRIHEALAEHDEMMLEAYVGDRPRLTGEQLAARLDTALQGARIVPLLSGSAITGAGVDTLVELLPRLARVAPIADPASGLVFKVARDPRGTRIAFVRMFAGVLRVRDQVTVEGGRIVRPTAVLPFGPEAVSGEVSAGQIAQVVGLGDVSIGDGVGAAPDRPGRASFPPPTLETRVLPDRPEQRGKLLAALADLAEQDPLINLRQDDSRGDIHLSLYGEVQKEVIRDMLAAQYGLGVRFERTTVLCVERLVGNGAAAEFLQTPPNPFLATVGLRVEPGPEDSGVHFGLEVELGCMPLAFHRAVEESVRRALQQGLYGWPVVDCRIILTHAGYLARQSHSHAVFDKSMSSTAGDFRSLTPLVLMAALRRADVRVCEPVHAFRLSAPVSCLGPLLSTLSKLSAVPMEQGQDVSRAVIEGEIPAAEIHNLQQRLPTLTGGEGSLETVFMRHRPVVGLPPRRARTDNDPTNRRLYLSRLRRA
jgi:ribosomal protection tetracycline resistance protein